MATEFICAIRASGSTSPAPDYTTVSLWETGVQCDLTSAATKVFSHGGITGTIADGASVTGLTSGATAVVVHCTTTQLLLETISGTFQSGEVVQVSGGNSVTLSNAGDSAIAVGELYNDFASDGLQDTWVPAGGTSDTTNYPWLRAAAGHGTTGAIGSGARMYRPAGSGSNVLQLNGQFCRVGAPGRGIEIKHTYASSTHILINAAAMAGFIMDSVLDHGIGTNMISLQTASIDVDYRNLLLVAEGSVTTALTLQHTNNVAENCAVIRKSGTLTNGITLRSGFEGVIKNTVVFGATNDFVEVPATGSTHNATDQASGSNGANAIYNLSSSAWVDYTNNNFVPVAGQGLASAGTSLSGSFTVDIAGNTRPTVWDVGPRNRIAGGAIVGSITTTFTPAAAMLRTYTAGIVGSVTTSFVPAATMYFSNSEYIVGSITTSFTPAAVMKHEPRYQIVGSVTTTFTPIGTLYGPDDLLPLDVSYTVLAGTRIIRCGYVPLDFSIVGSILTTFTPSAQFGVSVEGSILYQAGLMQAGKWASITTENLITDVDARYDAAANPNFPATPPWYGTGYSGKLQAWNSAAFNPNYGPAGALCYFGGGHNDYWGSDVVALDIAGGTGGLARWRRLVDPYDGSLGALFPAVQGAYPNGHPSPPHTYDTLTYDSVNDALIICETQSTNNSIYEASLFAFDFATSEWSGPYRHRGAQYGNSTFDPVRGVVWFQPQQGLAGETTSFDLTLGVEGAETGMTYHGYAFASGAGSLDSMMGYDANRDRLVMASFRTSPQWIWEKNPAAPTAAWQSCINVGAPTLSGQHAWSWSSIRNAWIYWNSAMGTGAEVYEVKYTGNSGLQPIYTWTLLTDPTNTIVPINPAVSHTGSYGKFQCILLAPGVEVLLGILRVTDGVFAFRIPTP